MTPPIRRITEPRRRACPMCDHGGFRRVMDHYLHKVLFQCTNCEHTWAGNYGGATDKRTVVRFNAGDE